MDAFGSQNSTRESYALDYTIDEIPVLSYRGSSQLETYHNETTDLTSTTYEENTFIDWPKESIKISRNHSFYLANKWIVVTLAAIVLGYIAAFIDFIQVTLNDLKKGICLNKEDSWSLLNPYLSCPLDDWYDWDNFLFKTDNFITNMFVNYPIYCIFAVGFSLTAAYLTYNRVYLIRQSGIPEIKLIIAGFNLNIKEYLSATTLYYKIIALIFVVSSGLWLGKEGPLVHVSCCIFNIIYDLATSKDNSRNEAIRRELISAATATGISVAFDSPIGGVLFVLESMPSFFMPTRIMWNSFVSATIAVIAVSGFKVFTDGKNFNEKDLFQVSFGNFSWLFMEIIPFILLGVLGGLYGHYFIKLNSKFSSIQFRKNVRNYLSNLFKVDAKYGPILEILIVAFITTILNFPLEISKLPLTAYLNLLFKDCPKDATPSLNSTNFMCSSSNDFTLVKLLYIVTEGFLLTSYTFGVDLPGGILMPSLVLGATTGRFVGILSQILQLKFNWESLATCTEQSCVVSPSSYAVIGAASFMTGITKLTMCVVVIMFEMTGAVTYVLPIMCGVMTSKFVNDWLCPNNIYDTWLQNNFNQKDDDYDLQQSQNLVNHGKGTGLISFLNSTSTIKTKLPDISVKSLMVPLNQVKCLCLIPENGDYTLLNLTSFINDDCHEGYPMIINYSNPVYLGYVPKLHLLSKLSNLDDSTTPISFQVENLPTSALSIQLHYERKLNDFIHLDIIPTRSPFKFNEDTPGLLIIEAFEKLNLNKLVIFKDDGIMCGFIDRFILTNLVNDKFEGLVNEFNDFEAINEYDLETGLLNEMLSTGDLRINRKSIELIT